MDGVSTSGLSTALSDCKNSLVPAGSEIISALEDAVLAGTRVMTATFGLAVNVYNGVAETASGVAKTTARGYHWANEYIKPLRLIGLITTGVDHALNDVVDAFHDNTKSNVARRLEMVGEMHTQLDSARAQYAAVTMQSKTTNAAETTSATSSAPAEPGTPATSATTT